MFQVYMEHMPFKYPIQVYGIRFDKIIRTFFKLIKSLRKVEFFFPIFRQYALQSVSVADLGGAGAGAEKDKENEAVEFQYQNRTRNIIFTGRIFQTYIFKKKQISKTC